MTTLPPQLQPRTRNPHTEALMRREIFWQIGVPMGITVILAVVTVGLIVSYRYLPVNSPLADVALMFLILIAAVIGVGSLVLLVGLSVASYYILREIPFVARRAQDFMWRVASYTKTYAGLLTRLFINTRSSQAAAQKTIDTLRGR